jgi:hypothetical protein
MGGTPITIDTAMIRALLEEQYPDLAELPCVAMDVGRDCVMLRLRRVPAVQVEDQYSAGATATDVPAVALRVEVTWGPEVEDKRLRTWVCLLRHH